MTEARKWWAMPSAMNAPLGALSADRSGAGAALIIGIALVSALLALAFLPRRARPAAGPAESAAPGAGETGVQRAGLGL